VLVYRCGFSVEKYDKDLDIISVEPLKHALYNVNSMMKKILKVTGANTYTGHITAGGRGNFRFDIFPQYKANRKDVRKPVYFDEIREFMVRKWKAKVAEGQEADDACSIEHCNLNRFGWDPDIKNSVVCSIDKDFNNIPGWHFNYVKDEVYYVNEIEAIRNFYTQILVGDASDGIPRIKKGWKGKQVKEAIQKACTEEEICKIVLDEINRLHELDKKKIEEMVLCSTGCKIEGWETYREILSERDLRCRGQLVWLRRESDEMWDIPNRLIVN
jgi:hypothetical protein